MSELDKQDLETTFANWKQNRAPNESAGEAFELFSIEYVLQDADLDDDEVESGRFGGPDDGGVDGLYLFVNDRLITDPSDVPEPALKVDLHIIQCKRGRGFEETAVEKMRSFVGDLLNFNKKASELTYINAHAREVVERFRQAYSNVLGSGHELRVTIHYATNAVTEVGGKVDARIQNLKQDVQAVLSAAQVDFVPWDARRLLQATRRPRKTDLSIEIEKFFMTPNGVVALVTLSNYWQFLTNENGQQRRVILESNVRAYQKRSRVNDEIRETLASGDGHEFWWYNNGVTILASSVVLRAGRLDLDSPQIVNGLQTSHEIYEHLKDRKGPDDRLLLLRAIEPPDEATRTKIIKATNDQTPVSNVSLHAMDPLHFAIEEQLLLYGLYYDRRKGHYRLQKKPIDRIVSMLMLAKSVIAILLQQPNDARARPTTVLREDRDYERVFGEEYERDLFVTCVLIDRTVRDYLKRKESRADVRRDIRYYVDMVLACDLAEKASLTATDVARLVERAKAGIDDVAIARAIEPVLEIYDELGATDKVAKGKEMISVLRDRIEHRWPEP